MVRMSLYYTARRHRPITEKEQTAINAVVEKYSVEPKIKERKQTETGPNWKPFHIRDPLNPTKAGIIFEGCTALPDNSIEACDFGLEHWCAALSEIRHVLADAEWTVSEEDHEIQWNSTKQKFDTSLVHEPRDVVYRLTRGSS